MTHVRLKRNTTFFFSAVGEHQSLTVSHQGVFSLSSTSVLVVVTQPEQERQSLKVTFTVFLLSDLGLEDWEDLEDIEDLEEFDTTCGLSSVRCSGCNFGC